MFALIMPATPAEVRKKLAGARQIAEAARVLVRHLEKEGLLNAYAASSFKGMIAELNSLLDRDTAPTGDEMEGLTEKILSIQELTSLHWGVLSREQSRRLADGLALFRGHYSLSANPFG